MLNRKLKTIASLINVEDKVIDIGCDHAYLAIYLKNNNICKSVYASDISSNVLEIAKNNILKEELVIPVYLSNGFRDIPDIDINTAIISGMGTSTIKDIIDYKPDKVTKFIISSNNNHYDLRKYMQKKGFYLKKEIVVLENNKFYPIMLFIKDKKKRSYKELKYGISKDYTYFKYLLDKEIEILNHIPKKHIIHRIKKYKKIKDLKKILKERN